MTEIRLYNTRTRAKEVFRPIDPANVRMYVCGPTVYDRAHIGNARPVVVFDVLYRLLRHLYGPDHVTYVRNFTDVDDRIIERAVATKGPDETLEAATRRITDETIGWYHDDMDALGALRPTHEPRCTEYIEPMVAMTQVLIDKGHAYAAEGHVLFAVDSWREGYGRLSGRSVDDMIAGARVEVAPYKKNPMDFVIWKPSTDEQPGWPSPWGRGRPGWHIECSAMADRLLWEDPLGKGRLSESAQKHPHVFDIHAGGIDLQFPHHENELAQSCCAHDTDVMANWWMHNEMLRVEGEKMSKSLGNFFTVRDLLDRGVPGEVIRFMLLSTHYRQTLDWADSRVTERSNELQSWVEILLNSHLHLNEENENTYLSDPNFSADDFVVTALSDDLNFHLAITRMRELVKDGSTSSINRLFGSLVMMGLYPGCERIDAIAGSPVGWRAEHDPEVTRLVNALLHVRQEARASRDFTRADSIRDSLKAAGIIVVDGPDGPTWDPTPDFDPAKLETLR